MTDSLQTKINFERVALNVREGAIKNESELFYHGVELKEGISWNVFKQACELDPGFSESLSLALTLNNKFWKIKLKRIIKSVEH